MHRRPARRGPAASTLLLLAALAFPFRPAGAAETFSRQYLTFGTLVEVAIYTADTERASRAAADLERHLQRWHREWSAWKGDGGLARLNRQLAAGKAAAVSAQLAAMLREAKSLSAETGGRFDPAIGGLIRLWGFDDSDNLPDRPPPDDAISAYERDRPSMAQVRIRDGRVSAPGQDTQIDLGAFAKGYGLDRAMEVLRGHGIDNAIVNAGGDLRVLGRHGDRPWRIGIRAPRGGGVLAAVEARDGEAVFTSGDYERFFEWHGRRYHHILNPATGYPARGLDSVTVITDRGARADAAATALFVAGPQQWAKLADAMDLPLVMVVEDDGTVQMTPAMAKRIQFLDHRPEHVETVEVAR